MGPLTSYAISVAIILALEYLAYKSLLACATTFRLNRVAIMVSYVIALLALPLAHKLSAFIEPVHDGNGTITFGHPTAALADNEPSPSSLWSIIPLIYIAGVMVTAILTAISYIKMALLIRSGSRRKEGRVTIVTVDSPITPFSWGRYVVVSRSDASEELIISHELIHITEAHSLDLIIARLMIIFNWFNPAAWLMADELSACHEYEVDRQLISRGINARQYQMLLIKKAAGPVFQTIANSLNHSQLKNRLTMMTKSKTTSLRSLGATALLVAAMLGVGVTNYPAIASTLGNIAAADLGKGSEKISVKQIAAAPSTPATSSAQVPSKEIAVTELPAASEKETTTPDMKEDDNLSVKSDEIVVVGYGEPAPSAPKQEDKTTPDEKVVNAPEVLPVYPGGEAAMMQALSKELKYPEECMKDNIQGRSIIQFTVGTDGAIRDIKVLRSAGNELLDAEAVRATSVAIKDGWTPGKVGGKPVAVTYTLPLMFRIQPDTPKDSVK